MCLIALSDSNFLELPADFWQRACEANPHGVGVMAHWGGRLRVSRMLEADPWRLARLLAGIPHGATAAVHLRYGTDGEAGGSNVHPHLLPTTRPGLVLALMHNGCIRSMRARGAAGPSDTALFLQQWLAPRLGSRPEQWAGVAFQKEVAREVGEHNRLVFLDSRGVWRLHGAAQGLRLGRTWLSTPRAREWLAPSIQLWRGPRVSSRPRAALAPTPGFPSVQEPRPSAAAAAG
ncbi:hypothetical protein D3C71_21530 [compost metagenome]